MGDCTFCGKPAGLLRHKHKECEEAHLAGRSQIATAIDNALLSAAVSDSLPQLVSHTAASTFIPQPEQRALLLEGWSRALGHFLEHGLLNDSQEARLLQFMKLFSLTKDDLGAADAFPRLVKAMTLRDLTEGKVPQRLNLTGNLPINLLKDEKLVWLFGNTRYFEEKIHREYVGGSAGVSVRVMKGLYLHTSAFHGHPIDVTTTQHVDAGLFAVTDKNIYFSGAHKSMRIPFKKIVAFHSYSDGISLVRDAASAKPQSFQTGDGWFTYNLVTNLARL